MVRQFLRPGASYGTASAEPSHAGTPGKRSLTESLAAHAPVQAKAAGAGTAAGGAAGGGAVAGGARAMPGDVQARMEAAFGVDFSAVRIHEGSSAAALGARAYTQGADVHFAPGEYQPTSPAGQELLGHELAHVVQQRQGRVAATTQAKGVAVNDDAGLEREADEQGARAARGEPASSAGAGAADGGGAVQRSVVQRKIGDSTNVIFGLSGRDATAIQTAVEAGYHTFDGADSYGDTIHLLAAAIKEAAKHGKARGDFEVIYKVDKTAPEALEEHLTGIAIALGGYIDHVLIHKVTDDKQAKKYEPILAKLKQAGAIKKIGAGDVKADMADHLAGKDSFEVDASDLFLGPDAASLVDELNTADKPVFVYNIIATAKKLLGLQPTDRPTQSQINALVGMIRAKVSTAEPILSSGSEETIKSNLDIDTPESTQEAAAAFKKIEESSKPKDDNDNGPKAVLIEAIDDDVNGRVMSFLFSYEWDAEKLFDTDEKYEQARKDKLALFTSEELAVRYEHKKKEHTLEELICFLFDSKGNCHRVEAYNFFMRI